MDSVTGLIVPKSGAQMVVSSGEVLEVPPHFFLHPQTGHVLPIQGNMALDPTSSKIVFTADSASGEVGVGDLKLEDALQSR